MLNTCTFDLNQANFYCEKITKPKTQKMPISNIKQCF